MAVWSRGGQKGKGFRMDGRAFLVTDPKGAMFEGLKAEKNVSYKVSLTFSKQPKTIPRRFIIASTARPISCGRHRYWVDYRWKRVWTNTPLRNEWGGA
jgi:hypothetical protein